MRALSLFILFTWAFQRAGGSEPNITRNDLELMGIVLEGPELAHVSSNTATTTESQRHEPRRAALAKASDNPTGPLEALGRFPFSLPLYLPLSPAPAPGTIFVMTGYVAKGAKRFEVNLLSACEDMLMRFLCPGGAVFHASIRYSHSWFFGRNEIVMNTFIGDNWLEEQRVPLTIGTGRKIELKLRLEAQNVTVYLDGTQIAIYQLVLPLHIVDHLHVKGDIGIISLLSNRPSSCPLGYGLERLDNTGQEGDSAEYQWRCALPGPPTQ